MADNIINSISYESTGDLFVDAGGMALEYLSKQFTDKTVMDLIEWASIVYVKKWGKLNAVFHGSPITHPTTKHEDRIPKTLKRFDEILGKKTDKGFCRFCGKEAYLTDAGRDKSCLVGSGAFVNFHHAHEDGLMICPDCVIKYFFLPFALLQMGNLALLQVTTEKGKQFWMKKTVQKNFNKISRNTSETMLKSKFNNPQNAIFRLAAELINEFPKDDLKENLTLYYFTNFAASIDCQIYSIPQPIFLFMSRTLKSCAKQWYDFVNRHYHISGSKWNEEKGGWIKKNEQMTENEYLNNPNDVFNSLLDGKSIIKKLRDFYKSIVQNQKLKYDSRIAIYYAQEVLNMTNEQIGLIRKIGNKIFDMMQQENNFKKYMVMLEGASRAYQLRTALIKIIKKNYNSGTFEPIVTLEEWVNYLFPDGQYWGEVRDLLLIFLYEKLHENKINADFGDEDDVKEPEEINEEA